MDSYTAYDSFELTQREITPEGFLKAPGNIARSGVHLFRAGELGLDKHGMDPSAVVRLHRPPEELFHPRVMAGYNSAPVIIGDKHETISAKNWKDHAVGDVGGTARNGDVLTGGLTVRDKDAVAAVVAGKKYLSGGYKFDLDLTSGINAAGEAYDGIQRNIYPNHVLICNTPRGGPTCRIADSIPTDVPKESKRMTTKLVVDGVPVEVDETTAAVVTKVVGDRDTSRDLLKKTVLVLGASLCVGDVIAIQSAIDKLATENTELKTKVVTPEQISALVNERVQVIGDAVSVFPELKPDGKTNEQVQREVLLGITGKDSAVKTLVDSILGPGKTIESGDATTLATAFRVVVANAKNGTQGTTSAVGDSAFASALLGKNGGDTKLGAAATKPTGRDAFLANQKDAWRK